MKITLQDSKNEGFKDAIIEYNIYNEEEAEMTRKLLLAFHGNNLTRLDSFNGKMYIYNIQCD